MGNFQGQQAERDHLSGPPAVGQEDGDVFITPGFTGGKEGALKAALFSCADKMNPHQLMGCSSGVRRKHPNDCIR